MDLSDSNSSDDGPPASCCRKWQDVDVQINNECGEKNGGNGRVRRQTVSYDPLFRWITHCLRVGKKKQLVDEDLPLLPVADGIRSLRNVEDGSSDTDQTSSQTAAIIDADRLIRGIMKEERYEFAYCALMCFIDGCFRIITPLLFHAFIYSYDCDGGVEPVLLVRLLPEGAYCGDTTYLSILSVVLFLSVVGTAVANNMHYYSGMHVGQRVRSSVIALVFQKYMTMRPDVRPLTGEVLSIATNEGSTFVEGLQYVNYVWVGFIQTVFTTIFLYELLGIYGVIGIAIYFLIIPLTIFLKTASQKVRAQRKVEGDVRIKKCSEMLLGMRVIKYFAWEGAYLDRIDEHRRREVKLMRNEFLSITTLWMCSAVLPMVAMTTSTLGYVFSGGAMYPSVVFGSVSLMISLRFLILKMGNVLQSIVSLSVAVRRIKRFLSLPSRSPVLPIASSTSPSAVAEIRNGTIGWGDEQNPVFVDCNIKLAVGDLHAVLGRVGSGKTTLCSAFIGEARLFEGQLYACDVGHTALVGQDPWVINATIRDNILFGREFDDNWFAEVVEACGLIQDLNGFPRRDLEEVGEEGITLSGGQKQRVCLARAVYAKCPLVLLDDPFSKLDPKTALHVYSRLLSPDTGILRKHSAVVLATNQPREIRSASAVTVLNESPRCVFSGSVDELARDTRVELDFLKESYGGEQQQIEQEASEQGSPQTYQIQASTIIPGQTSLMVKETRTKGATFSYKTLKIYFAPMGFCVAAIWPVCIFVERSFTLAENWLLSQWSREQAAGHLTDVEEHQFEN